MYIHPYIHTFDLTCGQAMRRELVPIVSPLINFARDRARRLPDEHAFPVPPDSMAITEAEFHLARKGLPHQTVKYLKEAIGGKDDSSSQHAQALLAKSLEARLPVDLLIFATLWYKTKNMIKSRMV
jgi:hypothetical protein